MFAPVDISLIEPDLNSWNTCLMTPPISVAFLSDHIWIELLVVSVFHVHFSVYTYICQLWHCSYRQSSFWMMCTLKNVFVQRPLVTQVSWLPVTITSLMRMCGYVQRVVLPTDITVCRKHVTDLHERRKLNVRFQVNFDGMLADSDSFCYICTTIIFLIKALANCHTHFGCFAVILRT